MNAGNQRSSTLRVCVLRSQTSLLSCDEDVVRSLQVSLGDLQIQKELYGAPFYSRMRVLRRTRVTEISCHHFEELVHCHAAFVRNVTFFSPLVLVL